MFERFMKNKREVSILEAENAESFNLDGIEVENLTEEAGMMEEEEIQKNRKHFTEDGLWKKIKKFSKKAGTSVIYVVLLLFFTMKKEEVPIQAKATIAGALGYFILPLDLIPDVVAGVGYADDLGVLMAALMTVAMYIDENTKTQAKNKLKDWFGDNIDTSDIDDKL